MSIPPIAGTIMRERKRGRKRLVHLIFKFSDHYTSLLLVYTLKETPLYKTQHPSKRKSPLL
jgi:hypothetical protein